MKTNALSPARREVSAAEAGFSLIELLIVMSIMLILMALIIPNVLKIQKNAHQTSAVNTVQAIDKAQLSYNSAYPSTGYACTLAALGGDMKASPTPQAAQLLDPQLASSGQKSGYTFAITCANKVTVNNQDMFTSYQVTAVPLVVGKTGDLGYCSDENNIVKVDPAGGTNCTQSLQ